MSINLSNGEIRREERLDLKSYLANETLKYINGIGGSENE
jgi:hypothetical protein